MAKKKEKINIEIDNDFEKEEVEEQTTVYSGTIEDICADDTVIENFEEGE